MNPIVAYQCDRDGVYVGEVQADPNPLEPGKYLVPGGAVTKAPPPFDARTKRARLVNGKWAVESVPDPEGA